MTCENCKDCVCEPREYAYPPVSAISLGALSTETNPTLMYRLLYRDYPGLGQ